MTNEEFYKIITADPVDVKMAEDGSYRFVPISAIENSLDEIFSAHWSWDFQREFWGRGYATGKGVLSVRHPVSGDWISRSGTAAVALSGNIAMDYPKLESATILSAAKKIGKAFGRDLNRDRDDAELPVIPVEKDDIDDEFTKVTEALLEIENREEAAEYLASSGFKHHAVLKTIVEKKKAKIPE